MTDPTHELQHQHHPTWCIHCGRFAANCVDPCEAPRTAAFDNRVPENVERVVRGIFALKEPEKGR